MKSDAGSEFQSVLAQPKRVALLAYLAVVSSRGFQPRDTLLGLFWPELDEEHARGALNSALYQLRRSLGSQVITSRGEEIRLNEQWIASDTDAFEVAVRSSDYRTALQLYRGELLQGWFVDDSPEFDRWVSAERLRLKQMAVKCAVAMADATGAASPVEAVEWARRAHLLAPEDEPVLRLLISRLNAAGAAALALRTFEEFAERMERDYGVTPSEATLQLVAGLRSASAQVIAEAAHEPSPLASQSASTVRKSSYGKLVIAAAVVGLVIGVIALRPHPSSRVLVATFENHTGQRSLDPIGEMSADWITEGVERAGVADVADRATAASVIRAGSPVDWLAVARRSNARLLLTGAYYLQQGHVELRAKLYDVEQSRITEVFEPVVAKPDSVLTAIQTLGNRAASAVSIAFNAALTSSTVGNESPPTYEAYLEYLAAIEFHLRRENEAALTHFLRAGALDSTFTQANLKGAMVALVAGRLNVTDSLLAVVGRRVDHLTRAEQLHYQFTLSARAGDLDTEARLVGKLARYDPDSEWPYMFALKELYAGQPRRAAAILGRMNPKSPALDGLYVYWVLRGMALHAAGEHRAELRAVDRGLKQYPANTAIRAARVRALASLGRTEQVGRDLAAMGIAGWGPGSWNPGEVMAIAAAELEAHGHHNAAALARARLRTWYRTLPSDRAQVESPWFGVSWSLYIAQLWPELEARENGLQRDGPQNLASQVFAALAAAQRGDTLVARRFDRSLAVMSRETMLASGIPYSREVIRGEIAAFLGDTAAALSLLQQAAAAGFVYDIYFHVDPAFAALRNTPAFRAMLQPKD